MGIDGNGDGKADPNSEYDVIVSMASYLAKYGSDEENIRIALWNYYKRDKSVGIVMGNAKLFQKYGRINLHEKLFLYL